MSRKKLIVWHYNLLEYWNGGTKFVHTIAKGLSKKYRVIIVANTTKDEVVKRFTDSGIEVKVFYRWPKNVYLHRLMMPIGIFIDALKSSTLLKKADHVIATAFPSHVVCAIAQQIFGIKFSYYCFEPTVMFFDNNFVNEKSGLEKIQWIIAARVYGYLDLWAVKKAKTVMTLTRTVANQIKKTYGVISKPTQVGVDTEFYSPRKKNWFESEYPGRRIIAHSTDYQPEKRLDVVIDAFSKLVSEFPDIILLVTSTNPDSPNKSLYEKKIKKLNLTQKIKLLGFIDLNKVPELYSAAICYVSTASGLQYGVTSANLPVKEAMACSTPVIRSPVDGEDVVDGETGFMVDPDNMSLLVKRLKYLLENRVKADRMGVLARKKIIKSFQWNKVISYFEKNLVANK